MSIKDTKAKEKAELVAVANAMLDGKVNLIEGCRKICNLRDSVDPDNDVFMPIEGIESETDHFPLGELRKQCTPDYLQRMDAEMERYLLDARNDIHNCCREIIHVFS